MRRTRPWRRTVRSEVRRLGSPVPAAAAPSASRDGRQDLPGGTGVRGAAHQQLIRRDQRTTVTPRSPAPRRLGNSHVSSQARHAAHRQQRPRQGPPRPPDRESAISASIATHPIVTRVIHRSPGRSRPTADRELTRQHALAFRRARSTDTADTLNLGRTLVPSGGYSWPAHVSVNATVARAIRGSVR